MMYQQSLYDICKINEVGFIRLETASGVQLDMVNIGIIYLRPDLRWKEMEGARFILCKQFWLHLVTRDTDHLADKSLLEIDRYGAWIDPTVKGDEEI